MCIDSKDRVKRTTVNFKEINPFYKHGDTFKFEKGDISERKGVSFASDAVRYSWRRTSPCLVLFHSLYPEER